MKKLTFTLLVLFFALLQLAQAQPVPDKDTAWTKDLSPETITGAKFTPDGSKIVVTTMEKIRVYDTESGEILKYYDVSSITKTIFCMDLHPNGRYIATGDPSKALIWDLETGDTLNSFNIIPDPVKYSADGNEILINYMYDNAWAYNELVKWNLITGDTSTNVLKATIYAMNISKDGRYLAIGVNYPYCYLSLWNYMAMTEITVLGYHESRIQDIDFSPDGKYIASAGYDGYIKIWDIENRSLYKSFIHDTGYHYLETVKFSPDSKFIVSGIGGANPNNTKIWNLETGVLIKRYPYGAFVDLDIDINAKYIIDIRGGGILYILNAYWQPIEVIEEQTKDTIKLYPNPTDGNVNINYNNIIPENISVKIFNISGQDIISLHNGLINPGNHVFTWNTTNQPSGTYFCKLIRNRTNLTYKIIINK